MADFLTLKKLEDKITDIIFHAKKSLLILSPYIKLDDYFKKLFSNHLKNPEVHIKIVFGKNEDNKGKSLSKDDFEFFKQFPNISILYLKDLHAKYYANENEGVVTSINLYDYSFKNNIEFGINSKNNEQSLLGGLATIKNPFGDNLDSTAWEYAMGFLKKAEVVFIKRPIVQKKLFGFSTNHFGSEVCFDNTDFFTKLYGKKNNINKKFEDFPDFIEYGKATMQEKPVRENVTVDSIVNQIKEERSTEKKHYKTFEKSYTYNQNNYNPPTYKSNYNSSKISFTVLLNKKLIESLGNEARFKKIDSCLQINTSNRYEVFIWNGRTNTLRISGILANKEYEYAKNNMGIFQSSKMTIELQEGGNGYYDLIWGTLPNFKTWNIHQIENGEENEIAEAVAKFIVGVDQFKNMLR